MTQAADDAYLYDARINRVDLDAITPEKVPPERLAPLCYADRPVGATNPSYYRSHVSGVECIDVIRNLPFSQGNAIKYAWRAGMKLDDVEDLNKTKWYLQDMIDNKVGVCCACMMTTNPKAAPWIKTSWDAYKAWHTAEPAGYRKQVIEYTYCNEPTYAMSYLEDWLDDIALWTKEVNG